MEAGGGGWVREELWGDRAAGGGLRPVCCRLCFRAVGLVPVRVYSILTSITSD